MNFDVTFSESKQSFDAAFGEVHNISDGGFERGYAEGYTVGYAERESVVAGIVDRNIVEFNSDAVSSLGANAFRSCTKLKTVIAPNATTVMSNSLSDCTQLTTAYLPNVTAVYGYAFLNCFALSDLVLTNVKTIYSRAFDSCRSIPKIDFHALQTIDSYAFTGGAALNTVIIRTEAVCKLNSVDAFNNTGIAKGTGFVYVPDNLVDSYKTAANWSTYASQIKPLSELEA